MDFSSTNTSLWNPMIQLGIISCMIVIANVLRRKVPLIRKSLMPTAVLAGFLVLILRWTNILKADTMFMEQLTYHMLGLGFIAMSLKIPEKNNGVTKGIGSKSGALIVSTYLVQAATGLIISILVALLLIPDFFKASGILVAMAYGQGPGQANNVGTTYEALGMVGGQSFGLSLAACGYLCACIVGVIFLNFYTRKKKLERCKNVQIISGSVTVEHFQDENEIPVAESIDKFSMQIAFVAAIYLLTYLATRGITEVLGLISEGLANTVSTLLWGFNFIIGSAIAIAVREIFKKLRQMKIMIRQYQNNYLLSRISGAAFDLMIVSGIASINLEAISGYWIPFILMAVAGGVVTFIYLKYMCNRMYPGYENEAFFSMYGMLTGTISSGILLLREIDPDFKTPAANNLVVGSSFGILFGAPVLLLVSMAAKNDFMTYVTFVIVLVYLVILLAFIFKTGENKGLRKGK